MRGLYEIDYVSYWNTKGEYGKERVRRMLERKKKRHHKKIFNCKCGRNHRNGWHDCPYSVEMSWGQPSQCQCCSDCTHECAMDV